MLKKSFTLLLGIFLLTSISAQDLTFSDIIHLHKKKDFVYIQNYLKQKDWEFIGIHRGNIHAWVHKTTDAMFHIHNLGASKQHVLYGTLDEERFKSIVEKHIINSKDYEFEEVMTCEMGAERALFSGKGLLIMVYQFMSRDLINVIEVRYDED